MSFKKSKKSEKIKPDDPDDEKALLVSKRRNAKEQLEITIDRENEDLINQFKAMC